MDRMMIGEVSIQSIIERDGPWRKPTDMFKSAPEDVLRAHLPELDSCVYDPASDKLVITYQTFVVRTPHHNVLIDTCLGDHKGYPAPLDYTAQPWLDGLHAVGLREEQIDYVFCTHLHIDHTGWNTKLVDGRWVPTFPNAKYIFHKYEYAYWEAHASRAERPDNPTTYNWRTNCLPVVEAGQALLVDDGFMIDDTIWLSLTPGHTPYHCNVNIASGGQKAIVTGDMMHHAIQVKYPEWSSVFAWDAYMSAQTRRRFLEEVAGTPAVILPVHFPNPTAGLVEVDGDRFRWKFRKG